MATASTSYPVGGGRFPRRFSDRYVLLKELGRGGMGQVYMAITGEAGAERVCALKIIRNLTKDRDPVELAARFLDEAKVVTKLSQENLVFVFDYGVVGQQGYLAMEFVQGRTLTELWNRCARRTVGFPLGISLFIVSELCTGLGYAHSTADLRLVHRDVSPSNVMLSYTGGVKLIDFGLAKWKSKVAETAAGINWGKVSYMSPEQHLGRPVDHRSDLFSAGVVLWEMLTGRQLFPTAEARLSDPSVPPPSVHNPNIPPELDAVILKATADDPADRYQSGEEMAAALMAHMPRDAGKLSLADFMRSLFEADIAKEAAERETLVAGAGAAPADDGRPDRDISSGEEGDRLLGTVLADRYFVRRLVGEGAMGRVYEGHHTGIGKRVAIKIPRQGERRKNELLQRFRLEAQAASQIRHPNIADVTDCGSTPDGRFFFVMEFVDGVDITHVVDRDGALPVERALIIAVQVCRALEAAHKAGIIHRDLKPSNVMLLRDRDHEEADFAKVLDFGVAKFLRADVGGVDLTRADAAVGTPKYMAPEQIEGGSDVDFRVDIYGVGGLLYFMLSGGHAPVDGDTVETVWHKKVSEEPEPLSRWRSDLPPDVVAIVARCLTRDPSLRPGSMESLRRDLLAVIEQMRAVSASLLGRPASSTSLISPQPHRPRRARTALWLGGMGLAVAAGVGLLWGRTWELPIFRGTPLATVAPERAPSGAAVGADQPLGGAKSAESLSGQDTPESALAVIPAAGEPPVAHPSPSAASEGDGTIPSGGNKPSPPLGTAANPAVPARAGVPVDQPAPQDRVASRPWRRAKSRQGRPRERARHLAALAPGERIALIKKAELAFQEGRHVDALRFGNQATAGGNADAWVLLGKVYRTLGQYKEAIAAYDRALRIDRNHTRAKEGRQRALYEQATRPPSAHSGP